MANLTDQQISDMVDATLKARPVKWKAGAKTRIMAAYKARTFETSVEALGFLAQAVEDEQFGVAKPASDIQTMAMIRAEEKRG